MIKPFYSMSDDFDELQLSPVESKFYSIDADKYDEWKASKPRECECYYSTIKEKYGDMFIEKSAYDALKAEADKLAEALEFALKYDSREVDGTFESRETVMGSALTNWRKYIDGR